MTATMPSSIPAWAVPYTLAGVSQPRNGTSRADPRRNQPKANDDRRDHRERHFFRHAPAVALDTHQGHHRQTMTSTIPLYLGAPAEEAVPEERDQGWRGEGHVHEHARVHRDRHLE